MSDFFKHLSGTSLFMKSDSDGTKDKQWNKMPLGIKSPSEGIQHFTNWQNISNTLERDNLVRLEDGQVNKVWFSQKVTTPSPLINYDGAFNAIFRYSRIADFEDTWRPNKVKILDDVAFVAQEEYTDVIREEIPLICGFDQYAVKVTDTINCGGIEEKGQILGSLIGVTHQLPGPIGTHYWEIPQQGEESLYSTLNYNYEFGEKINGGSLRLQDYQNCILRVTIGRTSKKYAYFIYGGALINDFHAIQEDTKIGLNFTTLVYDHDKPLFGNGFAGESLAYADTGPSLAQGTPERINSLGYDEAAGLGFLSAQDLSGLSDGDVMGYYFLVPQDQSSQADGPHPTDKFTSNIKISDEQQALIDQGFIRDPRDRYLRGLLNLGKDTYGSDASFSYGGPIGIQLCIQKNFSEEDLQKFYDGDPTTKPPFALHSSIKQTNPDGSVVNASIWRSGTNIGDARLIHFTPVRKCGKVDVYKRKRSFITASLDGRLISEDHGLSTGDIIEIKNVLLDESSTFFDSRHPLNGVKYVRVEDKDSFVVYDDRVLSRLSNISYIRTFDGVTWKSISNVNFESGQGWKFEGSIFSPLGKNGYRLDDLTGNALGNHDSTFYFTDKTLQPLNSKHYRIGDSISNPEKTASGAYAEPKYKGAVYLDFNLGIGEVWSTPWAKNIDESFPIANNTINKTVSQVRDSYRIDDRDKGVFNDPRASWPDYFHGMFFGCDFDVKFSHKVGSSSVYVLAIGEKGPDSAVDLFGISQGYCEIGPHSTLDTYPAIHNIGKAKRVPATLPRGRTHIFTFTLDQYNNFTGLRHWNTVFGGGRSLPSLDLNVYNVDGETKNFYLLREKNPWEKLERPVRDDELNRNNPWEFDNRWTVENSEGIISPPYISNETDIWNSNYWGRSAAVNWADIENSEWRINGLLDRFIKINNGRRYPKFHYNDQLLYFDEPDNAWRSTHVGHELRLNNNDDYYLNTRAFGTVIPNIKPYSIFGGEDLAGNNAPVLDLNDVNFNNDYYDSIFSALSSGAGSEFVTRNNLSTTLTFTPYETIEREWDSTALAFGEGSDGFNWYAVKGFHKRRSMLFPFVDGFGKSVAVKVDKGLQDAAEGNLNFADVPKVIVVSSSTSRSNIPFYEQSEKGKSGTLKFDQEEIKGEETKSQIGQLQANFLYASTYGYTNMDFMYINSGGSDCGRFFKNMTLKKSSISNPLNGIPLPDDDAQRALRPGSPAGFGYREVATSCRLSAMQVEWVGNELIWTDQELYNGRSVVNILKFDDSADRCFEPYKKITKNYLDDRYIDNLGLPTAFNTGDGFGIGFRYDGNLFVTNARSKKTELGFSIESEVSNSIAHELNFWGARASSDVYKFVSPDSILGKTHNIRWAMRAELGDFDTLYNDIIARTSQLTKFDRLDFLHVYEKVDGSFVNVQKISATLDKDLIEYYSGKILNGSSRLLDINGTINYSNRSLNSATWNIDFQDRYEISDGRIVFKDTLEYCLFERNPGTFAAAGAISATEVSSSCYPYLAVSEDTKYGQKYFADTTLDYNYISVVQNSYECASYGGDPSCFNPSKTPVIYFDIDIDELDGVQSVTIDFEIEDDSIFSQFDMVDLSSNSRDSQRTDNVIPRVVIYGQDPRTTIIKNGPRHNGTDQGRLLLSENSTRPTYQEGIYTGAPYKYFDHLTYYGYNFPGAFRGGAQDLFFYYRNNSYSSIDSLDSIDTIFGLPEKDSFLVSGDDGGLGRHYDSTSGRRLNGAGDPRYFTLGDTQLVSGGGGSAYNQNLRLESNPVLRSNYSRMAGLFMPVASADGYSVTIPVSELKRLLINGHVLRDHDRPNQFFNSFNDSTYRYTDPSGKKTLAVGFVLTNLTVSHGVTEWEEPSRFNLGPIRNMSDRRGNHRYPYQRHVNFYDSIPLSDTYEPYVWNGKQIEYQLRATVRDVSVTLNKIERGKARFISKYNKAATFSWHDFGAEVARQVDVGSSKDVDGRLSFTEYPAYFGSDKLVPVPNVDENTYFGTNDFVYKIDRAATLKFKNPIISISKESEAFPFVDDKEVMATESTNYSMSAARRRITTQTNIYLDKETGNLVYDHGIANNDERKTSEFTQRNFIGSFDLSNTGRNSALTLNITAVPSKKRDISLFANAHEVNNNDADLFIGGIGRSNADAPLFIGVRSDDKDMSLFIDPPVVAGMSLFTYEKPPSGAISLFHKGPSEDGNMTLTFAKPPSGLIPLYTKGPIQETNDMRLFMVSTHQEDTSLYASGIGFSDRRASLFIDSFGVHEEDMSLTFSAGHSGTMPLFIANHNRPTADLDLVIPSTIDDANGNMPLFISRNSHEESETLFIKSQQYYNTEDSDSGLDLLIAGPTEFNNSDTDLYVSGPIDGNNDSVDLYVRSIFPSGQMSLVTKPIGYSDSLMSLHMANAQETMPLYLYNLDGAITTLNISGKTTPYNRKVSLFMNNTDTVNDISLFTSAPKTDTISLLVGGSLDDSSVGFATLWTGKKAHENGQTSLFIQNSALDSVTEGYTGLISDMSVSVSGGYSVSDNENTTLFLLGQPFDSGNSAINLFVNTDQPILGEGGNILESGKLATFIEGNNDANVYYNYNDSSSLYIANRSLENSSADLYLHRPNEFGTTLFIQSLVSSGVADLYMSGAYISSGSADLYISPPHASGMEMFTRGYLE